MLTKVSTAQTSAYNGELRRDDDDREAQVLFEYDGVYGHLRGKAREHGLDLPPLFQKSYTDHGCVTGKHVGCEDDLNTFLQFLGKPSKLTSEHIVTLGEASPKYAKVWGKIQNTK